METPEASVALVFAGGEPVDAAGAARLPDAAFTVAADSGVEHALHNAPPKAWITSNVPWSSTTDPVSPTSTLLTPRVVPRWRVSP